MQGNDRIKAGELMLEFRIEDIVPKFILCDKNGYAMAKAIEAGMKYFINRIDESMAIITDIDSMPEWRLDEMAWESDARWYDQTSDIDEKRKQIRLINAVFSTIGTKAGVLDAVEGVFGEGMIQEWFQYGGQPFHYKVYVTDDSAVYDRRNEFMRILGYVQHIRSVLDSVEVRGTDSATTAYIAAAVSSIAAQSSAAAS